MPGSQTSEVPTVTLSFANNFWGKDDAGVGPLLDRMHFAKVTNDELKAFYAARAAIEEDYSKKLLQLSRKPLGSSETGTLRMSCDVVRAEVESMGKAHQSVAQQMHTELEEPLQAFAGGMKERRKIVQNGIEKLLKLKMQQTATVNKARDRYEQDCLKIKGFLAQAHMVMGHEERKNKARLEKTQINLSTTSAEYEAAVKVLEETTGRWNRDWKAACDKFQDLEEERIDYTKSSLWNFANIASTVCVSDDASCEKMRLSLEDCDVEKDITSFITEIGTGQEIPDPPKFINFCRGDAETSSMVSEDENYSVAQFARTMNPSYRASSPPISVFESHHDPNNPLAKELGLQQDTQPFNIPQDHINPPTPRMSVDSPRPTTASRTVQPDPRLVQAQQQARQQYQQSPAAYNDYPTDGMTQFCRPAAPSDHNAAPSPMRPPSRESHSDHSDLNSFSSIEPPSGSASPGKPMPPPFNEPSPIDDNSFQKKRGFFNSPFGRRKSKPEIETPASVTPTSRNTWAPAARRNTNENVSPTRPLGRINRQPMVQDSARSASPEPVDPRANFQLNVGNNVFDVASPDKKQQQQSQESPEEIDPIAAALEELRGVTKQSTLRVSADKFAGLATPQPPGTPSVGSKLPGGAPTPLANINANAAKRGTPPPSYEQPPMSRLGAPKPAHTARQMQKTTEMYVNQKTNVFSGNPGSRPSTRGNAQQEPPRATSPAPNRATSPRPSVYTAQKRSSQGQAPASPSTYRPAQRQQQQSPAPSANFNRSVSPNPYAPSSAGGRPRAQTATAPAQAYGTPVGRNSYSSTRGASPAMNSMPRAASPQPPQPAYAQSRPASRAAPSSRAVSPQPAFRQPNERPASSHSAAAMSMAGSERGDASVYGGSVRGRPQSSYYGGGGSGSSVRGESRVRSKSLAEPKNYNKEGRIILNYSRAMYTYTAQIPEELAFQKGDILAVLRLQDDGWWEAEVVGKNSRPGLVPSNYLNPV